ncbi:hypothetical protein HZS_5867 [Henneguya salminicola]|nr:hypothetical protein HZS_5867 [Henneguya salminicola]
MFFNEEFKPLFRLVEIVVINDTFRTASHTEECYSAAFKLLSDNNILSAKSVVVDFEMGSINVSYNLGTDVDVYGCLERLNMAFQFLIE